MKVKLQVFYHILGYKSAAGSGVLKVHIRCMMYYLFFGPHFELSLGKAFPFQVLWCNIVTVGNRPRKWLLCRIQFSVTGAFY